MADGSRAANDPTAHGELRLISAYCRNSGRFGLEGYALYTSAEPCVMCAGAIKWASLSRVVFSVSQAMLQQLSGGRPKPSCASIVNTGGRQIAVAGPYLVEAGLAALDGFDFAAHRQRLVDTQP
jgi:tRNA(adenine34) deaminase